MRYNYDRAFKILAQIDPCVGVYFLNTLGMCMKVSRGSGLIIILHSGMPPKMKAIVLAHELGHWFEITNGDLNKLPRSCSEAQANHNARDLLRFVGVKISERKFESLYKSLIITAGSYLSVAKAILGQFGKRMPNIVASQD